MEKKFVNQNQISLQSPTTICEKVLFCRDFLKSHSKRRQIRKWKPILTEEEQRLFDNEELLSANLDIIVNACGQHHIKSSPDFVSIHHFCRKGTYPKTSIQRQQMSDEQVPWNINFPDYNPPYYTDSSLLHLTSSEIDPEKLSLEFQWNTFDTNFHVDRRTSNPKARYEIDRQGYPLNPLGRTGLRGRGELKRWAVNYLTHLVIMCGTNQIQSGKEIFKLIMKKNNHNSFYEIPSTWTTGANMNAISLTLKTFLSNIYQIWNDIKDDNNNNNETKIDEIIKHVTFVSTAYIDDEKNTDNAWLETAVCCYVQTNLNQTYSSNSNLDLNELFPDRSSSDNNKLYTWHRVNRSSSLLDSERDVLQLIANRYNAYW